jgi:hypothetical protein
MQTLYIRYMQYREQCSTSASLGFRLEGITSTTNDDPSSNLYKEAARLIRDRDGAFAAISGFFQGRKDLMHFFRVKLVDLQCRLKESEWFAGQELIGSSLLFVYDQRAEVSVSDGIESPESEGYMPIVGGVWMIDFAHSHAARATPLSHEVEWKARSQEDGYLIGLRNLISVLQELLDSTSSANKEGNAHNTDDVTNGRDAE